MSTLLERKIRSAIAEFVTGQTGLEELHDSLAPIVWDIEEEQDASAQQLLYSVELTISEYTAGHRDITYVVRELERLVLYSDVIASSENSDLFSQVYVGDSELSGASVSASACQ